MIKEDPTDTGCWHSRAQSHQIGVAREDSGRLPQDCKLRKELMFWDMPDNTGRGD